MAHGDAPSGHDNTILRETPWVAQHPKVYDAAAYENDVDESPEYRRVGGVFIDAMSVCHPSLPTGAAAHAHL